MTFRPSDDVLDEAQLDKQSSFEQTDNWNQYDWQRVFNNSENDDNWELESGMIDSVIVDSLAEEVKAPDLSELLKNKWDDSFSDENKGTREEIESLDADPSYGVSDSDNNTLDAVIGDQEVSIETNLEQQDVLGYEDPDKISDTDRSAIVSNLEWSINSNLDLLVDDNWMSVIKRYKRLNRLFFRWWAFMLTTILGILSWVVLQAKDNHVNSMQILDDSSIENKDKWIDETPDKVLLPLVEKGVQVDVSIPYGATFIDWTNIQSKSNLIFYKWVVLPQLSSIDYNLDDFISLEDFSSKKLSRTDIKNLIDYLITKDSIYRNTTDIPNAVDLRWVGNQFWWSLMDWFNLGCVNSKKVWDFVCDKFLKIFYNYGKYYDLNQYASELLKLTINLKKQWENIEPICDMVKDYTLHAGITSDTLISLVDYCAEDDVIYYKKLVNFIDLENSLWQPKLSNKVFDDPDLNAYKLLSAQQSVYKILDGMSLNEGYIESYLEFVQSLINKDKWSNRYLQPIYKDLLYVFNMDELYQWLLQKWKLSSDLKLQIEQINNWSSLWSVSLLSQLTTLDIVQVESDFTGVIAEEKTLEELFSQYYAMTDRLKIRKADFISDDTVKVQTEVFTDKILNVTDGVTLKVTVVLSKHDNLLYVDSIKVANQTKLTDVLNMYLSDWNTTFYAMLNYIDEQVGMWYEVAKEEKEESQSFCEQLMTKENIVVYSCDDSSISLYKWEVEYNFVLVDWILDSFTISDENLESIIKSKLDGVLFMRDSTPTMIISIIDFTVESEDESIEKKLEIIDQFRIHFKIVPDEISGVEWNSDVFLINFKLWDFDLQGYYDINTHILAKIAYTNCQKPLEIKQLSLEITSENEAQLIEILNNPRVFFANVNPSVYKKYQKVCWSKAVNKNM